ncbi:hypothetical protein BGHDH14_bgh00104 [Blumeria hordei DH14]|uniref:Homoserine dehydrogenase n=1 Tax=Blumeria graminis f. sp. hordei (strain DH14) TaxID=546991 RepID=N1JBN0_BLUG1|nr:hypothetical protein BGHDH14_bgh00104 [Blumeria hordei DH14]
MASTRKTVYVAVIGTGGVGRCFLSQLENLSKKFKDDLSLPILSLILVSRSKNLLFTPDYTEISFDNLLLSLDNSTQCQLSIHEMVDFLANAPSNVVLIDNTSSQEIANSYPQFLAKGINIVTPNKKAFSGSLHLWRDIFTTAKKSGARIFHESSVGAGLPVISTLNDLIDTGDEIIKIEGVFSGTMSFLFNSFTPNEGSGGLWSAEVLRAKELGYTEPDPRDDLNGLDVARKLTILARLSGIQLESPMSFPVQSLIPKELEEVSCRDEFLRRLPEYDFHMEEIKQAAEKNGKVLRYVGSIDVVKKEAKVSIEMFDRSHPIAALKGSDNLISFYTKRYDKGSLIIQGAGAGGEVTAMGVTGDLLKVVKCIT